MNKIPYFVYGTTRLGDGKIPFEERVGLALQAMERKIWFHSSHQYGDALQVLGQAFQRRPDAIPPLMMKIGGGDIAGLRADIKKNLEPLGVKGMAVGQLCPWGDLAKGLAEGGPVYQELEKIRAEGLVRTFVLEVFPWTSETALKGLRNGVLGPGVAALIFYFNPLQRFASNPLWDLILDKKFPFVALRSVAGGDVHDLRDKPGAAWKPYLQERASQIAPLFERSDLPSWSEFCLNFAASFPLALATVGATSRPHRLDELLKASQRKAPLDQSLIKEILTLQRRWSEEVDVKAEPWTM